MRRFGFWLDTALDWFVVIAVTVTASVILLLLFYLFASAVIMAIANP